MTRLVDMAVVDKESNTLKVVKQKVESSTVNVRCISPRPGGHVFSDVITGSVFFLPGEIKTLKISKAGIDELRRRTGKRKRPGAFELTTDKPKSMIRDEVDTEDEQNANADYQPADEDEAVEEVADEPESEPEPVQRVERRRRKS